MTTYIYIYRYRFYQYINLLGYLITKRWEIVFTVVMVRLCYTFFVDILKGFLHSYIKFHCLISITYTHLYGLKNP